MRNRKITIGIIVTLVVAVISLGIAFAAFSKSLTINGNATVEESNWNVYFSTDYENCSNPGSNGVSLPSSFISEYGTGHVVSTLLTSNTFSWSSTLKSPGDGVDYAFSICNSGDYDADLTFNVISNRGLLTCTQNGVVTSEASAVCSHLDYVMEIDGCVIGEDECILANNNAKGIYVYLRSSDDGWAQDGSDLPKNPVTVTATPIVLTATQASSAH